MGSHKGKCYSSFNVHLQPRNCNRVQLKMCKKWEIFRIYDELYHCEALARVFFFFCVFLFRNQSHLQERIFSVNRFVYGRLDGIPNYNFSV